MKQIKLGLLFKVLLAILLGIAFGFFLPLPIVRIFMTFNSLFSELINFSIPLIIVGLVAPAIADIGKQAGKLLLITVLIAYGSTLISGFFTYFSCTFSLPYILQTGANLSIDTSADTSSPFFNVSIPPVMDVMTSLILAFVIGLGLAAIKGNVLKNGFNDFKEIIELLIHKMIIPFLPLYIFGLFLSMTNSGHIFSIIAIFIKIIVLVLILQAILLLFQFVVAGAISGKRPLKLLKNMMPAYFTALGTQSSAATIPVTLDQTIKCGVKESIADFTVPLCATIHLSGSTMKIVAFSMALMYLNNMPMSFELYAGFIFMLGITMVAAPGVPGGAIMASLGLLGSFLGFDENLKALMIALYIAIDSFGTACNVTGDGAIAVIVDKIMSKKK